MNGQFGSLTYKRTPAGADGDCVKENYAPWSTGIYFYVINEDAHFSFTLEFGLINAFHF